MSDVCHCTPVSKCLPCQDKEAMTAPSGKPDLREAAEAAATRLEAMGAGSTAKNLRAALALAAPRDERIAELTACLTETLAASAAGFRVAAEFAELGGVDTLKAEMDKGGVREGFGLRARKALGLDDAIMGRE